MRLNFRFVVTALMALALILSTRRISTAATNDLPTWPLHLNVARMAMPAVLVGEDIYVVGGQTATGMTSDIERVDPFKGTVETIHTKLLARMWHTAETQGSYIYIFGGITPKGFTTTVERYDTRDGSVQEMAPLPAACHLPASVRIDNNIFVIGGTAPDQTPLATMSVYSITHNTWTTGPPMPTARECAVAVCDQILYAVGGYDGKSAIATVEGYSLIQNRWIRFPALPTPLSGHHIAATSHTIRTFGDYVTLDRLYNGDTRTGQWTILTPPPGYVPNRHSAVVETADAIYVIGGNTRSGGPEIDAIQRIPR